MVFSKIMCINPKVVVGRLVVFEHAWRHLRLDGKRHKQSPQELPSEADVEMLLLVARGHHIAHFGIGQHALVTDYVALILDEGVIGG